MAFIPAILPALQVVGTVVSIIGALNQGRTQSAAADFNAQVSEQNAQIARQQAADQARQADRETYLRLGAIRAAQGASGGTADEGSVLDVLGDVAAQSELEKQDILYRGELTARGYTNTATLDRYRGDQVKSASYMKAGSELLSGATGYYKLQTMKRS